MSTQAINFSDLGAKPLPPAGQSSAAVDFSDLGGKRVNEDATDNTQSAQPNEGGPTARFFTRVFGLPVHDIAEHPGSYLNPFSHEYWQKAGEERAAEAATPPEVRWPGQQTYRDLESGNYAGAAGDVVGSGLAVASMLGARGRGEAPISGEVLPPSTDQLPGRPYAPRPRAASPYAPVESIPARSGLTLPGAAERVPLWQRAGIEAGPPPVTIDATPSASYQPVRAPRTFSQPPVQPVRAPASRSGLMLPGEVAPASEAAPAQRSQWPPENEIRRVPSVREIQGRRAGVRSRADINDDLAVQQDMRDWLDTQGVRADQLARRESIAGSSPTKTKSDLVREAGGKVGEKPVRYTRTPGVKASGNDYQGVDLNSERELIDLLKQSLAEAKRRKGK